MALMRENHAQPSEDGGKHCNILSVLLLSGVGRKTLQHSISIVTVGSSEENIATFYQYCYCRELGGKHCNILSVLLLSGVGR